MVTRKWRYNIQVEDRCKSSFECWQKGMTVEAKEHVDDRDNIHVDYAG